MRLALLASLVVTLAAGCASTGAPPTENAATAANADGLTRAQLAKLDEALRDRLHGATDGPFPVRVSFSNRPNRETLGELLLVRYGDTTLGRVSRAQLRQIAAHPSVTHVTFLNDAGYSDEDSLQDM